MEALVSTQNLSPCEGLVADAADVPPAGVCDHLLKPPYAVSTGAEAANAMASVEALVVAEVFQLMRTIPAFRILTSGVTVLKRPLGPGHREDVHQVDPAGTCQFLVWRGQFQLHVQVIFLLWCVNTFPNPNLSGSQGAVREVRAVGRPPSGADAGLLRLGHSGLLTLWWQRL